MKAEPAIHNSLSKSLALAEPRRVPVWLLPMVRTLIILADAGLALAAFLLAFIFRSGSPVLSPAAWAWSRDFIPYAGILFFSIPVMVAMLAYQRAYRLYGAFSYLQELGKVFKAVAVSSLLTVAWAFLFRGGFQFREFSYSRAVFFLYFAIALGLIGAFHLLFRYVQTQFRNRDINLVPTLIIGTNAEALQTINELRDRPDLGYRVVCVLGDESEGSSFADVQRAGDLDALPRIVKDLGIQEVIITDQTLSSERLFDAMMQIGRRQRLEFRFAPSLFNMLPQKTSVEQLGVLPMVRLFREPLSDSERFLKRISDLAISIPSIIVLSPLLLVISLLIKNGSRGPILFRQERVGMDGRIFLCYKFRTMVADADENLHKESYRKNIEGGEAANSGDKNTPVFGKVKDDPRITATGKWLRRTSLDELPQLFNVIRGEMSVVGPRPPITYEVEEYDLHHRKRLEMRPGITGLWQVSGRNSLNFEEMVKIDQFYIENWTLWLDLKIVLMTLPAMFNGDGTR